MTSWHARGPRHAATARSRAGAKALGPLRWRLPPTAQMHGDGLVIFGFPAPWPPRAGGPRPSLGEDRCLSCRRPRPTLSSQARLSCRLVRARVLAALRQAALEARLLVADLAPSLVLPHPAATAAPWRRSGTAPRALLLPSKVIGLPDTAEQSLGAWRGPRRVASTFWPPRAGWLRPPPVAGRRAGINSYVDARTRGVVPRSRLSTASSSSPSGPTLSSPSSQARPSPDLGACRHAALAAAYVAARVAARRGSVRAPPGRAARSSAECRRALTLT